MPLSKGVVIPLQGGLPLRWFGCVMPLWLYLCMGVWFGFVVSIGGWNGHGIALVGWMLWTAGSL